jgi:hypothetical protein
MAIRNVAIAHTAPAAAFVLHHARIGTGTMNKFGTSFQLSDDLFFYIKMVFLSIDKDAMNA